MEEKERELESLRQKLADATKQLNELQSKESSVDSRITNMLSRLDSIPAFKNIKEEPKKASTESNSQKPELTPVKPTELSISTVADAEDNITVETREEEVIPPQDEEDEIILLDDDEEELAAPAPEPVQTAKVVEPVSEPVKEVEPAKVEVPVKQAPPVVTDTDDIIIDESDDDY